MKMRTLFFVGMCALLAGVVLCCASSGGSGSPIGNATGTASATSAGFGGDVSVTVTMANGFITEVVAKGDAESSTVGGPALLKLPNLIKKYNTAQVDAIAGATITSMAVKAATQEAIDKIVAGN